MPCSSGSIGHLIPRVQRRTVEHPFGTLKTWIGSTHFLTRILRRVSIEMSLHVLAYNLKRVIAIPGDPGLTPRTPTIRIPLRAAPALRIVDRIFTQTR